MSYTVEDSSSPHAQSRDRMWAENTPSLKTDLEVAYGTSVHTHWSELRWPHVAAKEAGICGLQ